MVNTKSSFAEHLSRTRLRKIVFDALVQCGPEAELLSREPEEVLLHATEISAELLSIGGVDQTASWLEGLAKELRANGFLRREWPRD